MAEPAPRSRWLGSFTSSPIIRSAGIGSRRP